MFNALFQRLHNYGCKVLLIFLFSTLAVFQAKAQPPPPDPNQALRVSMYRNDFILGYAPAGSTIRLYYATAANPCIKAVSTPFKTIFADENNTWAYTPITEAPLFLPFAAPVVVSYIKPGTTEEVFESPTISLSEIRVSPNDCTGIARVGMFPGIADGASIVWKDLSGSEVGYGGYVTLPEGTYTMEYKNRHGCFFKSERVTVYGPAPVAKPQVVDVPCGGQKATVEGQFEGSSDVFLWERKSDGREESRARVAELPPGTYYFSAMANGGCWSNKAEVVVRPPGILPELNVVNKSIRDADCGVSNGSVTGITATVAGNLPLTYVWIDSEGNLRPGQDLVNAAPGKYTLRVTMEGGQCPQYLRDVEVKEKNSIALNYDSYDPKLSATSCGLDNGLITGLIVTNATIFQWYRPDDEENGRPPYSSERDLVNAAPGYYILKLSNAFNDCVYRKTFHIPEGSPAIVVLEEPVIVDDNCGLGTGSITGIRLNTAIKKYSWKDANGTEVGTGPDLTGFPAGTYTLSVESDKCSRPFPAYTIKGTTTSITPPVMEDVVVCAASFVLGTFKESSPLYRIYSADGTLISQSTGKDYRIKVEQPGLYYAALANGDCESPRVPFNISFGSSGLEIPSAFSPNGDGLNDKWIIKGIDRYLTPEVKIFNRQGVVVFHTNGLAQPFDGKEKGVDLPVGVYYYLVRASAECPLASGSLTLLR